MSLIVPAVIVAGGVVYFATEGETESPPPGRGVTPPPGSTMTDAQKRNAARRMLGVGIRAPSVASGPLGVDPERKVTTWPSDNNTDPNYQAALDAAYGAVKKKFAAMSADERRKAADALNKSLKLDPPLSGNESIEVVGSVVGGAIGGTFGPVGALVGAYLGKELADVLASKGAEFWNSLWTKPDVYHLIHWAVEYRASFFGVGDKGKGWGDAQNTSFAGDLFAQDAERWLLQQYQLNRAKFDEVMTEISRQQTITQGGGDFYNTPWYQFGFGGLEQGSEPAIGPADLIGSPKF